MPIRLTKAEAERIHEKAGAMNMSVSEYVRRAALGRKIKDYTDLRRLIREVNYIGHNINQAVKIMNTYHAFEGGEFSQIQKDFLQLRLMIEKYIKE